MDKKNAIYRQGKLNLWFMINNYIKCIEGFITSSYLHPSEETAHTCGYGFGDFGLWMPECSVTQPM